MLRLFRKYIATLTRTTRDELSRERGRMCKRTVPDVRSTSKLTLAPTSVARRYRFVVLGNVHGSQPRSVATASGVSGCLVLSIDMQVGLSTGEIASTDLLKDSVRRCYAKISAAIIE